MWVADIAAIVARHPELDWARAKQYAVDVGALRMLYLALRLSDDMLKVRVPAPLEADVAKDTPTSRLSLQVARWLPQAGFAPPALWERAAFRMSMRGGGIAGAAYLLRLSLSPTDEDWQKGAEDGPWWLWDALLRPLRLIRKYVWTGPLSWAHLPCCELQKRNRPADDHGPAPEELLSSTTD